MAPEFVLLVDPDQEVSTQLETFLEHNGYRPLKARGTTETAQLCRQYTPRLALVNASRNNGITEDRILNMMRAFRGKNVGSVLFSEPLYTDPMDLRSFRYVKHKDDVHEILWALREMGQKVDLMDERDDFMARLVGYSEHLEEMVAAKMAELMAANERLRRLSVTDELTGIHNRRYFFERLTGDMNLMFRYGHPISVLLLDIDDFKRINDWKGHLVGDAALRDFAQLLAKTVRKGETVARYGGEEFAVILPYTDEVNALRAAEKIRRAVELAVFGGDEKLKLTASIGVAEVFAASTSDEALSRADLALYDAKAAGKNRAASVSLPELKDCV